MKIFGLILVRANSKRLPNKCYLSFGKVSVLEHIIKRCEYFKITPIICTSNKRENFKILKIAKKNKIKYFVGSDQNKIKRMSDCVKKFKVNFFHTIDADDPFFCGIQVKNSIKLLLKGHDVVFPTKISSEGGASVGFSINSSFLHKLNSKLGINSKTEMMWKFFKLIKSRSEIKRLIKSNGIKINDKNYNDNSFSLSEYLSSKEIKISVGKKKIGIIKIK